MPTSDVAVTGVGLVTLLGCSAAATAEAWRSGASPTFAPDPALAGTPLGEVRSGRLPPLDPGKRLGGRRMLKFMSEAAMLGCVAAREACGQARLRDRFRPERVGLFAGTGLAAANIDEARPMLEASLDEDGRFSCAALGRDGLAAANPLLSFKILANMPPCLISIQEAIKGPNLIFSPWEAQSAEALVEAARAVADGEVDAALTGAADNAAHPATIVALSQHGRLAPGEHPAPAAAYLVLERAGRARREGHPVLALIDSIETCASTGQRDPIAQRLGRLFAAAPPVTLAAACLALDGLVAATDGSMLAPVGAGRALRARLRVSS
jgi:3-oxoacyl-(acyl-carrier-protein) synthase